jgi:hypothetical protein
VFGAFAGEESVAWPISSNVLRGDNVLIYCGNPVKQVVWICRVIQTGLTYEDVITQTDKYKKTSAQGAAQKKFMLLKTAVNVPIDNQGTLTFYELQKNGLKGSIMGPQNLNNNPKLLAYIINNAALKNILNGGYDV